ncbi:MAG TPA: hypothetical protein VNE82_10430 [Candidatus Binataceae bacterium]|nr:hypothetical protein [Candidatus Binataceae bacterium]HVB80343.1 hypothetical protein [Candidatus Binataceae bacterium]
MPIQNSPPFSLQTMSPMLSRMAIEMRWSRPVSAWDHLTSAVALEAMYCESRRSWLHYERNGHTLWRMGRTHWLHALQRAVQPSE